MVCKKSLQEAGKCQPPKKVLINKQLSFGCKIPKKTFVNCAQIYPFWGFKDHCVSHQPCQPPKLLGMNIFSSSQPLDKLHIPICREITQLNNKDIFGGQQSSQHIL